MPTDVEIEVFSTACKIIKPLADNFAKIVNDHHDDGSLKSFMQLCDIDNGEFLFRLPLPTNGLKCCLIVKLKIIPFGPFEGLSDLEDNDG